MIDRFRNVRPRSAFLALLIAVALSSSASAARLDSKLVSRDAEVAGLKIHYTTGGQGPAVILLHGYTETSRMWVPLFPLLTEKFTVIAPDLPGIGDSSIPSDGLDMKTAAIRIHALAKSLGVSKARVVGHDIGLMVAYAYAAQFPTEVEKLVLMDAFLPGVPGWEPIYNSPLYWHFRFHGPTPEALVTLVKGREDIFFAYFWNDLAADKNHSILDADRKAYLLAYSRPGRMRAAWQYFVSFIQAAQDFQELSKTKLTHAGVIDRRRQITRRPTRRASQVGGHGCYGGSREKLWPLDYGRTVQGNDGGAREVLVAVCALDLPIEQSS